METHILILATTHDFLWKFEREDVKRLQRMGYIVHYATNTLEPHYVSYQKEIQKMGVFLRAFGTLSWKVVPGSGSNCDLHGAWIPFLQGGAAVQPIGLLPSGKNSGTVYRHPYCEQSGR